jgi:hypothetical protein
MWPPGLNPEPKETNRTRLPLQDPTVCPHTPRKEGRAVYDVSTHELRHHTNGGATGLARPAHYRQTRARCSLERR